MKETEKPENLLETQKLSEKDKENCMQKIPTLQQSKMSDGKNVSQIALYEQQRGFFHKELLDSTNVLNESISLLNNRIKQSFQTQNQPQMKGLSQFERYDDRQNMETLAKLVQVKINFIKALK